jgi:outer membrane murein-binding lipoprotein Lpp
MSIEWGKVEAKKDKDHKVRGSVLIEMRAKIESLEKEVASLGGKVEGMKMTVETTTGEKDKSMKNLVDEKNKLQSNLEGRAQSLESKIGQLEQKNRELGSSLEAAKEETRKKAALADEFKKDKDELKKRLDYLELELQSRDFDFFKKYIKEKSSKAAKVFEQKPSE